SSKSNAQGRNPGAKWKIFGHPSAISKEYDKELKGFVFVLEGNSLINKMKLPRTTKQTLGLVQQFLTLQIFVPLGKDFSTELLITDFDNIKRRLYLSTVHKELSVTPLHAKIPLSMIKRKIWCNMCIDLVAFTYEIFRGALFQSLDGIIISANCKLRKIFTLKSKPKDTAKEDGASNDIPPTCQLNSDVPRVTQVLNMDEIQRPEIKLFVSTLIFFFNLNFLNLGILGNRGQGNICNGKTQDVSHIAFGSKILGPPPSLNRRTKAKVPGKVRAKFQQHRRHFFFTGISFLHCILDPEIQTQKTSVSGEADFQLTSPKVPSPDENSHGRLSLKNAAKPTWEMTNNENDQSSSQFTYLELELYVSDKWVFPERFTESFQLDNTEHFGATGSSTCCNLSSVQNASIEHHSRETPDHHRHKREVFTFLSKPRSPPYGKSPNVSLESDVFPLELELDSYGELEKTKTEDSFEGTDSSEEEYDRKKYQSNRLSSSEVQMLASMKRQQNEELQDAGISHGLSASQIDCCSVNRCITSDDHTAAWNSCFPPPVSQEHHYQKEMSPLSHSNPRVIFFLLSPLHTGGDHLSAEEDEVLTLLYDPCLNCYFDLNSGKYYELA
uniref:Chromosome 3 open reading frame 67 n=1 Tax=Zosterops lateralis melanops TaxID=1220523 RepID=A0A8D2PD86_ZOSLA